MLILKMYLWFYPRNLPAALDGKFDTPPLIYSKYKTYLS